MTQENLLDELSTGNVEPILLTIADGSQYLQIFVSTTYWASLLAEFFGAAALGGDDPESMAADARLASSELLKDIETACQEIPLRISIQAIRHPRLEEKLKEINSDLRSLEKVARFASASGSSTGWLDLEKSIRQLSPEARSLLATLRLSRWINPADPRSTGSAPQFFIPESWFINLNVYSAPNASRKYEAIRRQGDVAKRIGNNQYLLLEQERFILSQAAPESPSHSEHVDFQEKGFPLTLVPSPRPLSRLAKHPSAFGFVRKYSQACASEGALSDRRTRVDTAVSGSFFYVTLAEERTSQIEFVRACTEACQLKASLALQAESIRLFLENAEFRIRAQKSDEEKQSDIEENLVERLHSILSIIAQQDTAFQGLASSCVSFPNPYEDVEASLNIRSGITALTSSLEARIEYVGRAYNDRLKADRKRREASWRATQSIVAGLAGYQFSEIIVGLYLNHIDRDDRAFMQTLQVKTSPEEFSDWVLADRKDVQAVQATIEGAPGGWRELNAAVSDFGRIDMQATIFSAVIALMFAAISFKWSPPSGGPGGTD